MANVTALQVNGARRSVDVDPERSLLSVLRDDLDLTGSKYGCGEGRCGACTVMIDGKAARACVTRVGDCTSAAITTIEGLAKDGQLHPLQKAFLEVEALQCGYCTPGMIMAGVALLSRNPQPTFQDVCKAMDVNVCRCGTYVRIVQAIRQAGEMMKGGRQ